MVCSTTSSHHVKIWSQSITYHYRARLLIWMLVRMCQNRQLWSWASRIILCLRQIAAAYSTASISIKTMSRGDDGKMEALRVVTEQSRGSRMQQYNNNATLNHSQTCENVSFWYQDFVIHDGRIQNQNDIFHLHAHLRKPLIWSDSTIGCMSLM